jgi:predicted AAA+ superfamily ATPase
MATYRDDFAKYVGRMQPTILDAVLLMVANLIGRKFVYARVGEGIKQHQAKHALELLAGARLVTIAPHTHAMGLPLGGDVNPRNRKAFLLDVGLLHALLGTPAGRVYPEWRVLAPGVRAKLAEQLAAQQLRVLNPAAGHEPSLHYWQRTGGRPGEIDLVVQIGQRVVPVEQKAGAAGAMKSLHQFVHDKRLDLALRIDSNPPSLQQIDLKTTLGDQVRYTLLGLPGYLLWRAAELVTMVAS